ncbi:precorrin-6y C5,15-methyltransferase (decarboxylating) subunit CbiE [Phaeobacter sp. 22II1-1F12B]|uniref:precorrin-6y C5,15-methyltransferase (decarboxylating) subunit CbiE n=1 Tax=Phaeobacter sp. 22II1-1F12B TaxID=1317111 RepID=UPI000B524682|nr:precorrin-6y C5,15-methyltransferase (decarboxylating) subunit CbiE [Phaeobacter sp. 22II1-1F12B]OWU81517.1 precorrin-6Y methyltransferase [Phaeobacter sp. 22II1-1F12B]
MSDARSNNGPWLTIIGIGEDGPAGLTAESRAALAAAEIVMGAERHLTLIPETKAETVVWPVPFKDGLSLLDGYRGRPTVVLASGDPFWFGAGSILAGRYDREEWRAFPAISTFQLAASRMGWPLEKTTCLGLHAAPLSQLRARLAPKARMILLLRDGEAVGTLANWLVETGFGDSDVTVMEALGGPRERLRSRKAQSYDLNDVAHPVCVALDCKGAGSVMPRSAGLTDDWFDHDGQITKRPVRALTLSALAPRPFEHLWDIGAGSGSIGIEWLMRDATLTATAFESNMSRAARATENSKKFGLGGRIHVVEGKAIDHLDDQTIPDAVFIGGGLDEALLQKLWGLLPTGTRLVANAVTLESEALLANWQADKGGELLRIELAEAAPLGRKRGWKSAYPIVQWSVTL